MDLKRKLLDALDRAAAGDWDGAHEIVQDLEHPLASWIHANLHREEGDRGNAGYWYDRAGRTFSTSSLAAERADIADAVGRQL